MSANPSRVVDFDSGLFTLEFPFDRSLNESLKQAVPGSRFNSGKWVAPASARHRVAKFCVSNGFTATETAMDEFYYAVEETKRRDQNIEASQALDADFEVPGLKLELRPFQRAGVKYAIDNIRPDKGICFGDEMGLGKTPESLATLHLLKAFPAFICVPSNVWLKWAKEVQRWLPDLTVCLLAGKVASRSIKRRASRYNASVCCIGDKLPKADIYVVSHANVAKWIEPRMKKVGGQQGGKKRSVVGGGESPLFKVKWKSWVWDEAHAFKSLTAQRTRAVMAFALASNAPYRIECSGTWAPNRPEELLLNLQMLNRLDDVAHNEWDFLIEFCNGHKGDFGWDFTGASNEQELQRRMRRSFYVQRDKKAVLPELPPFQFEFVDIELSNQRDYAIAERDLKTVKAEYAKLRRALEAQTTEAGRKKWRGIAKAKENEVGVLSNETHKIIGLGKVKGAIAWLEEFLRDSGDAKILVFGIHREVNEAIADHFRVDGLPRMLLYGGVDAAKREDIEEAFADQPEARVLVAHPTSGGVGINLTAATHVAFVELPYRPMDMDQAIARAYGRIVDVHGVNVYVFMGMPFSGDPDEGTIDDHIWAGILMPKSKTLKKILSASRVTSS